MFWITFPFSLFALLFNALLKVTVGTDRFNTWTRWVDALQAQCDVYLKPRHLWKYHPRLFNPSQLRRLLRHVEQHKKTSVLTKEDTPYLHHILDWLLIAKNEPALWILPCLQQMPYFNECLQKVSRLTLWPFGIKWVLSKSNPAQLQKFLASPFEHPGFKNIVTHIKPDVEIQPGWSSEFLFWTLRSDYQLCQGWINEHKRRPKPGWYYLHNMTEYNIADKLDDSMFADGNLWMYHDTIVFFDTAFPLEGPWCWAKVFALYGAEIHWRETDDLSKQSESFIDALHICATKNGASFVDGLERYPPSLVLSLWLTHPDWKTMTGLQRAMALDTPVIDTYYPIDLLDVGSTH